MYFQAVTDIIGYFSIYKKDHTQSEQNKKKRIEIFPYTYPSGYLEDSKNGVFATFCTTLPLGH